MYLERVVAALWLQPRCGIPDPEDDEGVDESDDADVGDTGAVETVAVAVRKGIDEYFHSIYYAGDCTETEVVQSSCETCEMINIIIPMLK